MSTQDNNASKTSSVPHSLSDFGTNEWIVEDMYQRYLADPSSVEATWHDFFADYQPGADDGTSSRKAEKTSEATTTDRTDGTGGAAARGKRIKRRKSHTIMRESWAFSPAFAHRKGPFAARFTKI